MSGIWQIMYSGRIGSFAYRLRQNARGTLQTQRKPLSNRNVMKVFPPERRVKYAALA